MDEEYTEQRAQLNAIGSVNKRGEFEILAITEGEAIGHGWKFSAEVLRRSMLLADGVECFVNHVQFESDSHSVRDLGGVYYDPTWNESEKGVQLKLRPFGPSGPLVVELGREMLADGPKPKVGFSADIGFTAKGQDVIEILRYFTIDLVFDPARGGAFLRALNSVAAVSDNTHGGVTMEDEMVTTPSAPIAAPTANADVEAMRTLLSVQQEKDRLAKEADDARALRVQMCSYVLDSGLAAAKLPDPVTKRVRDQFAGKVFEPGELNKALDDARQMVSELIGPASVSGLTHVHQMFDSGDQIRAAVDDLFEAPREPASEKLKVAKLRGIRELYLMLTGDEEFYGGYYPERARLNTGNFTNLVANVMNKVVVTRWAELGRAGYDWWKKIVHVEHFTDLKQITWLITGTVASLPTVAKGAEYTPLFVGDGKETSDFTKYGGYVGLDLEDLINDDTRKMRVMPRELASAAIRNVSSLVAAIFTDNSAIGPTMADGGALFNNTAVTTVGGHANLLTTALGTTFTAWEAVAVAMYKQALLIKDATGYAGTGKRMALRPKFCLTPIELAGAADALFVPRWSSSNSAQVIPTSGGQTYAGVVEPIVVPEWTDADNWAAVADPLLMPGVCIGEAFGLMPEIFVAGDSLSPAVFMNDESRIKVRHWIAVGVADFRPLHKSNV